MNKVIVTISLLSFIAILFLPPVHLQAESIRAPNLSASTTAIPGIGTPRLSSDEDIRDILGPVELPKPIPYILYATIALVVLILAVIGVLLLKRKRKTYPIFTDPAETALSELRIAEERIETTGTTTFAAEVSAILRTYIEQRFMIPSTKQTTSEFFSRLNREPAADTADIAMHNESLGKCLDLCDLAKYANYLPESDAIQNLSERVRDFIDRTRAQKETD